MFADPIGLLVAYLGPVVAPVPVSGRVPRPRPPEFVQVRRVGGVAVPPVREIVRVDVFAWAADDVRAIEVGGLAREALWSLAGTVGVLAPGEPVYTVAEFKGPGSDDDEETGSPRYWFTVELMIRANQVLNHAPT